ncbi:hypothetical protein C8F01DRAFT_1130439 [Mycena amicta]|nr:hypothetical protein C8F01DRAFT_1130439 [Mycena amicta]
MLVPQPCFLFSHSNPYLATMFVVPCQVLFTVEPNVQPNPTKTSIFAAETLIPCRDHYSLPPNPTNAFTSPRSDTTRFNPSPQQSQSPLNPSSQLQNTQTLRNSLIPQTLQPRSELERRFISKPLDHTQSPKAEEGGQLPALQLQTVLLIYYCQETITNQENKRK